MQLVLGLLTFFLCVTLFLCVIFFLRDKFTANNKTALEAEKIVPESEEKLHVSYGKEYESLTNEGEQIMKAGETINEYEMVEEGKKK